MPHLFRALHKLSRSPRLAHKAPFKQATQGFVACEMAISFPGFSE